MKNIRHKIGQVQIHIDLLLFRLTNTTHAAVFYEMSADAPLCIVDLWDQTDVCHGDLKGKQRV